MKAKKDAAIAAAMTPKEREAARKKKAAEAVIAKAKAAKDQEAARKAAEIAAKAKAHGDAA